MRIVLQCAHIRINTHKKFKRGVVSLRSIEVIFRGFRVIDRLAQKLRYDRIKLVHGETNS